MREVAPLSASNTFISSTRKTPKEYVIPSAETKVCVTLGWEGRGLTDDVDHEGGEDHKPAPATVRRRDGERERLHMGSSPLTFRPSRRLLPWRGGLHWDLLGVEVHTDWLLFIWTRHPRSCSVSQSHHVLTPHKEDCYSLSNVSLCTFDGQDKPEFLLR